MSFYCPWQDGQFEKCRRTGDTPCLPGKPGCVLFGKVDFAEDADGRRSSPRSRLGASRKSSPSVAEGVRPPTKGRSLPSRHDLLDHLRTFPARLRAGVVGLSAETVVGRWSLAQVVHHLADVHGMGLFRVRRALTEVDPKVEPYDHESWARLEDAGSSAALEASMAILEGIHIRWEMLLRSLAEDGWARTYRHPEGRKRVTVAEDLAWHVEHGEIHLEAIRRASTPGGPS